MDNKILHICGIEPESIVDGPGIRYVIFVQGCPHHCEGCHNPESWPFDGGYEVTVSEIFAEIQKRLVLGGVTFSGGEPFEQAPALMELAKLIKRQGISLMSYSGYTLEELEAKEDAATMELLGLLDILVDGRYIAEQRNLTLQYRGSENQRVIDMTKTREAREKGEKNAVVLYDSSYVSFALL